MDNSMDIPSSSDSLTSRSTESMEIDNLSVVGYSPPRPDTPFNNAGDDGEAANQMSTDTEKRIIVTGPMELADPPAVINGHGEEEEEVLPVHQKRKRTSTINYDDADFSKAIRESPIDAPVKRSKPGKNIRGVIIGIWRDSDQADDEDKHVVFGFIDIHDRLRTRIYGMNRRGKEVVGNAPTGAGGCWVTFERIIFDSHLASLSAAELKEYVKIRSEAKPGPTQEERDHADAKAVTKAKAAVAQQEAASPSGKPVVHKPIQNRHSASRQSLPRHSLHKTASFQAVNAADIQTPKGSPIADNKPYGVLLGYWLDSAELRIEDKHAVYGVLSETDCFRVKVQRLTRDGRYVDSNFPIGAGALWLSYKKVVLEPHLTSLTRPEVKEYCRIRQREQVNKETEKERRANELRAVDQARINVAKKGQDTSADVPASPELEIRHSARSENRASARHQAEADAAADRVRKEKAEAMERQHEKTRKEVAIAEAAMAETAAMELKNNLKKLNKVWVAQHAAMNPKAPAPPGPSETTDGEVKYHHGIKYERKQNGPFQGKLVSQAQILSIDGEDYVEYRILTKPSF
ncbi:uncharacterized protein RAG0_00889 [Rhynchosporium agropyri]|uniref:Uncharacterized protein n=1 Tax=Rhynchosporium agropyri TaxID=914238 RepID=A0A1E1JUS6_9HELO|nr:uncharacterized protein RAG0_00889 [Rhynchosporium agropyri]